MEEEKKIITKKKTKPKTWGDKGFVGKVLFGCYEYTVKFISETQIASYIGLRPEGIKTYGGINCDEQVIYIADSLTDQTKKLTLLHELTHMMFLNNNVGTSEETLNVQDETLVDNTAARLYELMRRNPELMRWLLK